MQSPEVEQIGEDEIIPNLETEEKRALFEADRKRRQAGNELRSNYVEWRGELPPIEDPMLSVQNSVFSANLFNMDGEAFYIIPETDQNLVLYSQGAGLLAGFTAINKESPQAKQAKFYVKAVSSLTGFSNTIVNVENKDYYLTTGTVRDDEIAYVKRPTEEFAGLGWGAGWDIRTRGKGTYTIKSAHAFKVREDGLAPLNYLVIERKRPQRAKTIFGDNLCCLSVEDLKNKNQSMILAPVSNYVFKGIRFFGNMNELYNDLYTSENRMDKVFTIVNRDDVSSVYKPMSIGKPETFTSTREYTNDTDFDVEYDMYFDDKVSTYSNFEEYSGLRFSWSEPRMSLPYIEEGMFRSSNNSKWEAVYGRYTTPHRTLSGMLPLVVSPRTHVKVTYTYRKYRVILPYVIYLESNSAKYTRDTDRYAQGRIVGLWTGEVYEQDLGDMHHYERKSIGSGSDDDIEFGELDFDALSFDGRYYQPISSRNRSELRSLSLKPKRGKGVKEGIRIRL